MIKHYYIENNQKVYFTKEQEEELTYGRLSKELIGKVGSTIFHDVTCKVRINENFENIEAERTEMYLQREVNNYENCYVYIDENGNHYIEETYKTFAHFHEYNEEFIPLIPLKGEDLKIINSKYGVNLGGDE